MYTEICLGNLKGRDHLEDVGVGGLDLGDL